MVEKKNIAVGFVIYNSNTSLLDRLRLCTDEGFEIYVFDNSPQDEIIRTACKKLTNCTYLTNGKNVGLGFGLSAICAQAYYDFFPALLFFDQDTVFDIHTLLYINSFYINNANIENQYSSVVFNAKKYHEILIESEFKFTDVLLSISSGSLFFLKVLQQLNWHNQTYFVDCVDYEFCLNSNNHRYKIGECSTTPGFDHVSEQEDTEYNLLGKKLMMRKYSLNRIRGTIIGSLRLFFSSIRNFNWVFSVAIFRSMSIYIYFQGLVRAVNFLKKNNG